MLTVFTKFFHEKTTPFLYLGLYIMLYWKDLHWQVAPPVLSRKLQPVKSLHNVNYGNRSLSFNSDLTMAYLLMCLIAHCYRSLFSAHEANLWGWVKTICSAYSNKPGFFQCILKQTCTRESLPPECPKPKILYNLYFQSYTFATPPHHTHTHTHPFLVYLPVGKFTTWARSNLNHLTVKSVYANSVYVLGPQVIVETKTFQEPLAACF